MGSTVCAAVADDPELELVAAVDPFHAGIDLHQLGVPDTGLQVARSATAIVDAGAEVVVDFTVLEAARENLFWCADHGVHAVVGTTGFGDRDLLDLASRFEVSPANAADRAELRDRRRPDDAVRRARGAVLRDRGGHRAAPRPEGRRAVGHRDAHREPHGRRVVRLGRRPDGDGRRRGRAGERRPAGSGSTRCACAASSRTRRCCSAPRASRCRSATTRYDRTSFMPGVLLAIRKVREHAGLTVGLDAYLGA